MPKMPLAAHPRASGPISISQKHWLRPEGVVEGTYLTWTEGGPLRLVSYQGQREDRLTGPVVRPIPPPGGRARHWSLLKDGERLTVLWSAIGPRRKSQFNPFWFTTSGADLQRHSRPNYVGGQRLSDRPRVGCHPASRRGATVRPNRAAHPFCFVAECLVFSLLDVEAESAALDLLRALYDLTDGLPQQWCMLEELRGATNSAAIYAFTRGWIVIEGGHSTCLTETGRRLVETR
jgi:hypothetical protein